MPKYCQVPECHTKQGLGYSLHEFPEPNDADRRRKWARFCEIENPTDIQPQHVICEKHFPKSAFAARNNRLKEDGRNTLNNDAIPELNSPADLRQVGYSSPVKGSPVKKKSRRNEIVVAQRRHSIVLLLNYDCIFERNP